MLLLTRPPFRLSYHPSILKMCPRFSFQKYAHPTYSLNFFPQVFQIIEEKGAGAPELLRSV
jgi:hypothetical protein